MRKYQLASPRGFLWLLTLLALLLAGLQLAALPARAAPDPGASYRLTARHSGKVVDVTNCGTADGTNIQQWSWLNNNCQQWQFQDAGGGFYRVVSRHSGKCLDVNAVSTADGAAIIQWACGGGANQQWQLQDAGGGFYRLVARHSGKCLDVNGASTADGAAIIQWACGSGANQQWSLGATGTTPTPTGSAPTPPPPGGKQLERLGRGLVKVAASGGNFLSWRLLGSDPAGVAFNLYRGTTRLNAAPLAGATNYFDSGAAASSTYSVRPVLDGVEQADAPALLNVSGGYHNVPLQVPAGGTTPDGVAYTYAPGDASVGDLDGDGEYEIVLKWDPSNQKDNSQSGYTGNVFLDAYKLSGTRLWRINLGRNIRAGAHYTQVMVYDLDGDGKAEVAVKTADGTVDGAGRVLGSATADHRNSSGYILAGPEFLTVFSGQTGAALATTNYVPARGTVSSWGDSYGNRVDRFLAGIAYLDGQRPSLIMARGYYTRSVIAAWDFRNGQLTQRWVFDSNVAGSSYTGQGNHQLSIADADADGRDEIMYGSMAIDDTGRALWNNRTFHGDAYHVGDLDPSRPGLEVFKPSEHKDQLAHWFGDARTGQIIWSAPSCNCDNGRGVAADIWAGSPGAEAWSSAVGNLISAKGQTLGRKPSSTNFLVWWDGDPVRELLDSNRIDKYGTSGETRLLTADGAASINGTKSTPVLSADLFGDWREEVIWRAADNRALRIYTTSAPTTQRIYTLMHDAQYRVAIAWQNVAYNQPPHPSFFIGSGMTTPAQPNIYVR